MTRTLTLARGTWLEDETAAYPNGGQVRRGRAIFPDGTLRAVYAGIPDTYFSVPAHARIGGKYVAGYLTTATASGLSTATDDDPAYWSFVPTWRRCPSRYPGAATLLGRPVRCGPAIAGGRPTLSRAASRGSAHGDATMIAPELPMTAPDWCSACERVNRRCRFGDPHGLCSCWRGQPCQRPGKRARLYLDRED